MWKSLIYKILLQVNFFLVAFLNITKDFIPYPLRNIWLRIFNIKVPISSSIHRKCYVFHLGRLSIGQNSVVNFGCYLDNRRGIMIGSNTAIAHNTKIYTLGHNIESPEFETRGAPVKIGSNCFIYSNVLIMPGVTINDGAIVLPGSIVTKDVDAFTVVGGNPAKFIMFRNNNIKYKISYNYYFAL
jgi:acetyltransferase-like isoleucine patch superfamily enzyme